MGTGHKVSLKQRTPADQARIDAERWEACLRVVGEDYTGTHSAAIKKRARRLEALRSQHKNLKKRYKMSEMDELAAIILNLQPSFWVI